jgi:hypothetical protein
LIANVSRNGGCSDKEMPMPKLVDWLQRFFFVVAIVSAGTAILFLLLIVHRLLG